MQPDLVHVTTPPAAHFAIAEACLSQGCNVLCEKPITRNYEEFEKLARVAKENGRLLMENQNFRYHSSVRRIRELIDAGEVGDVIDVQISIALNLFARGSPYIDTNAPHFSSVLAGGIIGDFLPHIAYLAYMFTGPVADVRTVWTKRTTESVLPADEFRGLIKGERASAFVGFSGNANPNAFWLRLTGTKMYLECDLFQPPRLITRRLRSGEPALGSVINGIGEGRDILRGTLAAFWRKLGGRSSYDGLPELIARTYRALQLREPQPIALQELDDIVRLVGRFTSPEGRL
jgi:predicted dehydrogenase